jgi:hypothetical protein
MGKGQHDAGARNVRMLFNVGTVGGLTDGQLLEQFTAEDGEVAELASSALIERHGPMVLGVCRSVLRDPHEADDAFHRPPSWFSCAGPARSGYGTHWDPGSIGWRTASPHAPTPPRPAGAGTSGGRPNW